MPLSLMAQAIVNEEKAHVEAFLSEIKYGTPEMTLDHSFVEAAKRYRMYENGRGQIIKAIYAEAIGND
jgi:hypothetical protein